VSIGRTYNSFFDVKLAKRSEGTKKQYRYTLKSFEEFTKANYKKNLEQTVKEFKKIKKIEKIIDNLQEWINQSKIELRNQKLRTTLLNTYLYYRGVNIDPRDLKDLVYEQGEPEERQPLLKKDLMNIVASTKKPIRRALYLAMASSGMRIGEACFIRKKDIDTSLERMQIIIHRSYTKRNGRSRIVFVSKEAEKELKPILERKQPNDLVFTDSKNPIVTKENEMAKFRRLIDALGIGERYESGTRTITLHNFRAYFFTEATQKHGIAYAHRMTGHKGYLEEYARWSQEKKLEKYLELEPDLFVFEPKPETEAIVDLRKDFDNYKETTESEIKKLQFTNAVYDHYLSNGKFPEIERKDGKVFLHFIPPDGRWPEKVMNQVHGKTRNGMRSN